MKGEKITGNGEWCKVEINRNRAFIICFLRGFCRHPRCISRHDFAKSHDKLTDVCHLGSGRVDHNPFIFVYHFSRSLGKLSQEEKKDIKGSLSKGSLNFDISIDRICLVGMNDSFYNRIADDQRLP